MRYSTPQFIESEGKIVYFLTYKQFFWLVGAGAAAMLFYYILPFPLFVICSLLTGIPILIIAFVKINNESVIKIFLNFLGFLTDKKTFVWKKRKVVRSLKSLRGGIPIETIPPEIKNIHLFPSVFQTSKLKEIKKRIETKR